MAETKHQNMKLNIESDGRVIKKSEIKIVVRELNRIEQRDGSITPENVVDAARPATSSLHKYFTWDNDEAAELYRRQEARKLIHCVRVSYDSKDETKSVRAYVSMVSTNDEGDSGRGYIGLARVLSDAELRSQMLAEALDEAKAWRERYQHLNELSEIFMAISKVAK